MAAALIPHPTEYVGPLERQLIDERQATRFAAAYDDGAYRAVERIFAAIPPIRYAAMHVIHQAFAPSYTELRDFLIHEHNVPLVLAARIALRLTRQPL